MKYRFHYPAGVPGRFAVCQPIVANVAFLPELPLHFRISRRVLLGQHHFRGMKRGCWLASRRPRFPTSRAGSSAYVGYRLQPARAGSCNAPPPNRTASVEEPLLPAAPSRVPRLPTSPRARRIGPFLLRRTSSNYPPATPDYRLSKFLLAYAGPRYSAIVALSRATCRLLRGQTRSSDRASEQQMDWLFFLGRFHVVMLHLPIGIILAAVALEVAGPSRTLRASRDGRHVPLGLWRPDRDRDRHARLPALP